MPAMAPLEMPELVAALEVAADDEAVPDADAEGDADADAEAEAEADFEGEGEAEAEADVAPREIFFDA
jgi:S-DNA-T family DNA segregation ATPase FtsK/SpoIIIE